LPDAGCSIFSSTTAPVDRRLGCCEDMIGVRRGLLAGHHVPREKWSMAPGPPKFQNHCSSRVRLSVLWQFEHDQLLAAALRFRMISKFSRNRARKGEHTLLWSQLFAVSPYVSTGSAKVARIVVHFSASGRPGNCFASSTFGGSALIRFIAMTYGNLRQSKHPWGRNNSKFAKPPIKQAFSEIAYGTKGNN